GNTSQAGEVVFTVARGGGVPAPNCAEFDERRTVFVGEVNTSHSLQFDAHVENSTHMPYREM
ncbi:hypothetical protein ACFU76_21885, partial [Streptomyces sp. NPDC057539]|uniref:hypothetical protein n=1 Tax=Streptomyces sp. NPDC057539 TaxID=3346159 RepID=UPI0036CB55DA